MVRQLNTKELGKSILILIIFCSLWFEDFGITEWYFGVINIVAIIWIGYLFIKSMEKLFN